MFDDLVEQSGGDIFWVEKVTENHDTFMSWHGDSTDSVGGSGFIASRLIPAESFATEESRTALTDALIST